MKRPRCMYETTTGRYEFPQLLNPQKQFTEKNYAATVSMPGLADHSGFHYLTRSSCFALDDVDDLEDFEKTVPALPRTRAFLAMCT